jgi:hypothetical protein
MSLAVREELEKVSEQTDEHLRHLGVYDARTRRFDRKGEPISHADWCEASEDDDYMCVAEDTVDDLWISTVWLGLDHNHSSDPDAPPLIFETMVFDHSEGSQEPWADHYMNRFATEEEALRGHREAVLAAEASLIRPREDVD